MKYTSTYAVPNLGTIFFIFLSFLILVPISIFIAFFASDLREIRTHSQSLKDFIYWKGTIRFFTESYMEILLAVGLNVANYNEESEFVGVMFSNYFAIAFFALSALLPLWIVIFFWCNIDRWGDKGF